MSYDKELIIHKLERWDRFITNYHLPDWDSIPDLGLYMDQVVVLLVQYLSFIPSIPGGKGELRHLLRHQQLCAPEDHACSGEAEVLPGTHRLPHYDPHHEAEHQHQRRAENFARRQQRGLRAVGIRGLLRKIPAAGPVLQPAGPKRRHRHPHPPPGTRRGAVGGWSSSADSSPGSPKFWRRS